MTRTNVDPAFTFIRDSPTQGAVLEVPYDAWSAAALGHQTYHERPIVGGYTSRHFPYPFSEGAPGVSQLFFGDPDPITAPDILSPSPAETGLTALDYYKIRYIVVHKGDLATGRYGRLQQVLNTLFTDKDKVYEDDREIVYQTPQKAAPGGVVSTVPLVGLGAGWHKIEQNPLHRWTGSNVTNSDANVWVGVPPGAEGHYNLDLTAYSYKSPRHLSVVLDGRTLAEKEIGTAFQDLTVDLGDLPVGDHQLTLAVREPPESPPGDTRKLGLGVTKIALEKAK